MTESTQQTRTPIQGRVAQILNERELVVNVGIEAGVKKGMKFAVLSEKPIEITDPDSGNLLGVIDREKIRVEAHDIKRYMCVCRTYRMKGSSVGDLLEMTRYATFGRAEKETLRAEDTSLPKPLSPEESFVKIKDRVVEVFE
jgi:hypothetical protein